MRHAQRDLEEERLHDERKICRSITTEKYLALLKYPESLEDFLNVYLTDHTWYLLLFFSSLNSIYTCTSYWYFIVLFERCMIVFNEKGKLWFRVLFVSRLFFYKKNPLFIDDKFRALIKILLWKKSVSLIQRTVRKYTVGYKTNWPNQTITFYT